MTNLCYVTKLKTKSIDLTGVSNLVHECINMGKRLYLVTFAFYFKVKDSLVKLSFWPFFSLLTQFLYNVAWIIFW